jgi:hypothetical protein
MPVWCSIHAVACRRLLPVGELGLPDLVAAQHDVEHALHGAEQLLVRRCGAALKICDDGRRAVALCGEVLLRHGGALVVLGLGARLGDGLADHDAHRLGLDDVVGAVDLGETLALRRGALWVC